MQRMEGEERRRSQRRSWEEDGQSQLRGKALVLTMGQQGCDMALVHVASLCAASPPFLHRLILAR
eukprot:754743-Hanusia_phi.AAC.1